MSKDSTPSDLDFDADFGAGNHQGAVPPGHDDDFDFEPVAHDGAVSAEDDFDFDFGPDSAPSAAPSAKSAAPSPHLDAHDDFDDAPVEDDGFGVDDGFHAGADDGFGAVADEAPEDDGEYIPGEGDDLQPVVTAPKMSLVSKLILPVGGVLMAGVSGAVAYNVMFSGHASVPPPHVAPVAQQAPDAPQLPTLPPPGAKMPPAGMGQGPSQPAPLGAPALPPPGMGQGSALPAPLGAPTLPPPGIGQAPAQPAPLGAPALPPPVGQGPSQPAPGIGAAPLAAPAPVAAPAGLESALNNLVDELRGFKQHVDAIDDTLATTKSELFARMDKSDAGIAEVGQKVGQVEQRVGSLEQRLTAVEAGRGRKVDDRHRHVRNADAVAERPAEHAEARKAEARKVEARKAELHKAEANKAEAAKALADYRLRGVSRDSALLQTPSGLVRVDVGQSLGAAGVVKSVRQEGGAWLVETSNGVIRP